MKTLRFFSILFILGLTFSNAFAQEQETRKKIDKVTFKTSIDCQDCVNTIMSSVPLEKGVKNVVCDLDTKEVMVEFKTKKTDKKKVQRMIEKLGYTAEEVKEKEVQKKEKQTTPEY